MKDLHKIPIEALEAEIERRKLARPKPLVNIEFSAIVDYIEDEGIDRLARNQPVSDDFEHSLFENTLEIIYGYDIWTWWNKQTKNC